MLISDFQPGIIFCLKWKNENYYSQEYFYEVLSVDRDNIEMEIFSFSANDTLPGVNIKRMLKEYMIRPSSKTECDVEMAKRFIQETAGL